MENRDLYMQDNNAVAVAPEVHSVLLEDGRVRVLNVYLAVGEKAEMHWHPDSVSYIVKGGRMKVTKLDGAVIETELESGKVISGSEGEHTVENIGNTDIHTIQTEFLRAEKQS